MALSREQMNFVCKDFNDAILAGLDNGSIDANLVPEMADTFLNKLYSLNSEFELPDLFNLMASKWPAFSNLATIHEGRAKEASAREVAQGVTTLLQGGKIDQALALAKSHTQPK